LQDRSLQKGASHVPGSPIESDRVVEFLWETCVSGNGVLKGC